MRKPVKTRASRSRPSAVVRAEHGGAPVRLKAAERKLFDEALRMGTDLADELESRMMSFGRWLLSEVFANDAALALDDKSKNPIWVELVARAGGPTLRIGKKMLYVAVRLAAYDKRIGDQAWHGLDAGRKEILLPLRDDRRLREAAQHVSKFNLTQIKTAAYVGALMAESGEAKPVRLTAPMLVGRMKKIQEALGGAATLKRVRALHGDLSTAERQQVASEIDKVRDVLSAIAREVRGR